MCEDCQTLAVFCISTFCEEQNNHESEDIDAMVTDLIVFCIQKHAVFQCTGEQITRHWQWD